jgi:hypothetical protein
MSNSDHGSNAIQLHATMLSNGCRLSLVLDQEGRVGFVLHSTKGEVRVTAAEAIAIQLMDRPTR